ncbi:MAG TPA: hypothetical protein VMF61_09725, partial [Candidatus Acidoferrales bacterium]|nr:hypothetical protein [Candidatus Acidoferrales bacterium]
MNKQLAVAAALIALLSPALTSARGFAGGGARGGGGGRPAGGFDLGRDVRPAPQQRPAPQRPAQQPQRPAQPQRPQQNAQPKQPNRNVNTNTPNRNVNTNTPNRNGNTNSVNRNVNANNINANNNINRNVSNNTINRTVINNPVYVNNTAWGWNHGVAWAPAPYYWGGGFWGALAIGTASAAVGAAVYGSIVNSQTHTTYYSYQTQPGSPGATLLSNYQLQQTQCGPPNLVVIYGPENSVICA